MANKRNPENFLKVITDFVAAHPHLAAALASQMGALAARFIKDGPGTYKEIKQEVTQAPSRLADALPAIVALMEEAVAQRATDPAPARTKKRAKAAKSALRTGTSGRKAPAKKATRASRRSGASSTKR